MRNPFGTSHAHLLGEQTVQLTRSKLAKKVAP
jgi:hypothetical protein